MPYNGKLIFNSLVFINLSYGVVKLGLKNQLRAESICSIRNRDSTDLFGFNSVDLKI